MPFLRKYTGSLKTAARKQLSAIAIAVDAYFNYVTLLLQGDGTNGAQNNTFLDSSTNAFTITRNGNTTQGSFSPYGSNWSNYFNGSTNTLDVPTSANNSVGTGSFCFEAFIYMENASAQQFLVANASSGGLWIGFNIDAANKLAIGRVATAIDNEVSYTWTNGTWYHIAVNRSGTNLQFFVNGTQVGSTGSNSVNYPSQGYRIGSETTQKYFSGYISNFRLVRASVYTTTFTPSTTPLTAITDTAILTCQSNRFIDNSTNAFALTANGSLSVQRFNPFGTATAYSTSVIGGSGYFDGTGDNLSFANGAGFDARTGDFTIECWVNPNSTSQSGVVGNLTNNNGLAQWQIFINYAPSNKQVIFLYGTSSSYLGNVLIGGNTGTLSIGSWNHIAITRSSTTIRVFLNGLVVATDTTGNSFFNNNPNSFVIGSHADSSEFTNGYITDVRVIQGTALYTSAFTPPTAPLTAVSGTSVLTNMTNGAIFDNAMMNDLETVGNAQISTSVYKYGTGSLYFDGTGDALRGQNNTPNLQFGTGNFTVECWLYQTATNTYPSILEIGNHATQPGGIIFIASDGSTITAYNGAAGFLGTAIAPTLNTWNHIAWVRNNGVFKIYVNGVGNAGFAFTGNLNTSSSVTIGAEVALSAPYTYQGYMDELRVTKGYARYTANFTAPTAAFQNIGPY